MRDTMAARGPDGSGLLRERGVILGHRRLAIRGIDNGGQPWLSPDRNIALVYNGEIYNDDELRHRLRARGFRFRTTCDTEVLLAAWLAWGPESVPRLRGMFAFAVFDFRTNELFLVRDRCGVKPLYYSRIGRDFVFASTIQAITRHPDFSPAPNLTTLRHYLSTLRITLDRDTFFDGVYAVRPAEMLRLRDGHESLSRYWSLPHQVEYGSTFEDCVDDFQVEFERSVSLRLKSDVPVGMMMSGGVDSNTLAVCAKNSAGRSLFGVCGGGDTEHAGADDDFQYASEWRAGSRL